MSQYKSTIQNLFLATVRKRHQPVEVVLNTGTSLRGKIKGFDQFSISLIFRDKVEVIYKSAILFITVLPRKKRPFTPAGPGPVSSPLRRAPGAPMAPGGTFPRPQSGPFDRGPATPLRPPPRDDDDYEDNDPPPPRKVPPPRRP